jgi:mannose-6-phosphate isomerase-like protein (cupin superfamily)
MDRRAFLAISTGVSMAEFSLRPAGFSRACLDTHHPTTPSIARPLVLVRSGFRREPDGIDEVTAGQETVVRSSDSEGRLAAFVVPVGTHVTYYGAPLHVHHEQDECIHVVAGEFVAEVDGQRMRLKPGDSLLMPMRMPHRCSVAQDSHCGPIHLYTPAGLMDTNGQPLRKTKNQRIEKRAKPNLRSTG